MNDDDRLKQTFDKLRSDDERRAPSFEAVRKKRAPRTRWAVVAPLASAAAAAAVFVVWCGSEDQHRGPGSLATAPAAAVASAALAVDDGPLDFLLDVPGLHGAPDFDTSLLRGSVR